MHNTPVIMGQMYNIYNIKLVIEHLPVSRPNPTFNWLILLSLVSYHGLELVYRLFLSYQVNKMMDLQLPQQ